MQFRERKHLKRRRTKIVATVGPACESAGSLAELIDAGVDAFRLNFSHGKHETHTAAYRAIRAAAEMAGSPVAVLADLCGPKIRVGRFEGGRVHLMAGSTVTVTTRPVIGGPGLIPSEYTGLAQDVRPGCPLLLADGLIELRVEAVDGPDVTCTVVEGGTLSDRKGINLPGVELSAPSLTAQDRADAALAIGLGVDYLALSFVRSAADVKELRTLLPPGRPVGIIAKIERPEALQDLDAILDESDGVMVARGDLGVELEPERVPIIQRELVSQARSRSKPAIVATQMLESMTGNSLPTRAEVSDVSTAVFSGADAVMLSAETAVGAHPVQAVAMMNRIAREVEGHLWTDNGFAFPLPCCADASALHEAVGRSIAQLSRDLAVRAIAVVSKTGASARMVASARPAAPVVAITASEAACRQMALLWGVVPVRVECDDLEQPHAVARACTRRLGLAEPGHRILAVSGLGDDAAEQAAAIAVLSVHD